MTFRGSFVAAFILLLAGCGGGTGGGVSGSVGGGNAEFADSAGDTFDSKSANGGVTGNMVFYTASQSGVSKSNATLSFNSDYTEATLRVLGRTYTLTGTPPSPTGPGGTVYTHGSTGFMTVTAGSSDHMGSVNFGDGLLIGFGMLGAETRPENLPDTDWRYDGLYTFQTTEFPIPQARGGFITLFVDFMTDDITGEFRDGGMTTGTVTGSVVGNDIDASVALIDATMSGTLAMEGTFFGPTPTEAGGILSGTLGTSTGTQPVHGTFSLSGFEVP